MSDLIEFYAREELLDHAKHPRNKGKIDPADIWLKDSNPLCGDKVEVFAQVEGDRLSSMSFDGEGCFISQAAASRITEELKGKKLVDILEMGEKDVNHILGNSVTAARLKCALLPLAAIQKGIRNYLKKSI